MVIDPATEAGARVTERLRDDVVAWLVTVAADGTPVPTPIWFVWDGETILLYSQPDKPKLRHIAAKPRVAVALRTDVHGDIVTVVTGEASVDLAAPRADAVATYVEKYDSFIRGLGFDRAGFAAEYSVPIRIRPTRVRHWESESVTPDA